MDRNEPDRARTGSVNSNGYNIYWQCSGRGHPIILVHGWGSDTKSNWADTGWIDALAPRRQVVSLDIRGHGRSDKPLALDPYSYALMSADVLNVLDALDIEQSDFMGYSMGAFIGAYLLGHHANRFASMVLGGIGDETEESAAQGAAIAAALRAVDASAIDDTGARHVRAFVRSNPLNELEPLAYSALKMWPEGYPIEVGGPGLSSAQNPVLIVNGENDHPYVDSADRFANTLQNARHVKISGCDHLTTVTDPRFKKAVDTFLS